MRLPRGIVSRNSSRVVQLGASGVASAVPFASTRSIEQTLVGLPGVCAFRTFGCKELLAYPFTLALVVPMAAQDAREFRREEAEQIPWDQSRPLRLACRAIRSVCVRRGSVVGGVVVVRARIAHRRRVADQSAIAVIAVCHSGRPSRSRWVGRVDGRDQSGQRCDDRRFRCRYGHKNGSSCGGDASTRYSMAQSRRIEKLNFNNQR